MSRNDDKYNEKGIWPIPDKYRVQSKPLRAIIPILVCIGIMLLIRDLDLGKTFSTILYIIVGVTTLFVVNIRINGDGPEDQ